MQGKVRVNSKFISWILRKDIRQIGHIEQIAIPGGRRMKRGEISPDYYENNLEESWRTWDFSDFPHIIHSYQDTGMI